MARQERAEIEMNTKLGVAPIGNVDKNLDYDGLV